LESPFYTGSPSCRAEMAVQNVKSDSGDIGFSSEIQRGIPSSTNEFTYNITAI
jgi:hypothetical protein